MVLIEEYSVRANEYQLDRVSMVIKNLCILVVWTKEASASEGLNLPMLSLLSLKAKGILKTI